MSEPATLITTHCGTTYKVVTSYWPKPIPERKFDWSAVVDGNEDWKAGYGRTERDAVLDLKDLIEAEE